MILKSPRLNFIRVLRRQEMAYLMAVMGLLFLWSQFGVTAGV